MDEQQVRALIAEMDHELKCWLVDWPAAVKAWKAKLESLLSTPPQAAEGSALIAAERARQVAVEGWTPEHDAAHVYGELVEAAECYAYAARSGVLHPPRGWPWEPSWWKPSADPVRNLVKAGALLAAEIDRRRRGSSVAAEAPAPREAQEEAIRVLRDVDMDEEADKLEKRLEKLTRNE